MSVPFEALDDATLATLRTLAERELSSEEVAAALAVPISPEERAGVLELVEWFERRYPTPADRLAYVRRAYHRWTANARSIRTNR